MEKRVLLAVFLSFLVLIVYQALFVKPMPPKPAAKRAIAALPPAATTPETPSAPEQAAVQLPPPVEVRLADTEERDIAVETDLVRAVFSNRGAELKSWLLKRYRSESQQPLDLVPKGLPLNTPRPFALAVPDAALSARLRSALFQPSALSLHPKDQPATLAFEYSDATGLTARKTFRFDPRSPYVVRFTADVSQEGRSLSPSVLWGPALGDSVPTTDTSRFARKPEAIFFRDGKVSRLDAKALASQPAHEGRFGFVGVDDHYFLTAAVAPDRNTRVEYQPLSLPAARTPETPVRDLIAYTAKFSGGPSDIRYILGPKDFDVLAAVDRDLVRVINYGMFSFLVVPLLRSLKWIHGYVGNYGWSIIILTVLINAAMFPLRHKSVVSLRKMQELQPEIKAIQDRYAGLKTTDPARQKMNVELMNLYRERGANPASGCVPMLLTMPVLFAFYSLLSESIEIRGAPFMLWIRDLSAHDPLYVTPILMGLSMLWQQMLTPSGGDPQQQKMMMLMPVMFTFMFLWAPSGLVLYWLVSNLWAIGQQQLTNRIIGPPVVKAVRPPAERRLRKVGSGKSTNAAKEA